MQRPSTLEEARQVTEDFVQHDNFQRPNQALSCGNQPPRTAFAILPSLRSLPQIVDPDSWLDGLHGWHVERKVDAHGMVKIERTALLRGKLPGWPAPHEASWMSRRTRCMSCKEPSGSNPCRSHEVLAPDSLGGCQQGLVGHLLTFEQFLAHMRAQAKAEHRLRSEAPNAACARLLLLRRSGVFLLACSATMC